MRFIGLKIVGTKCGDWGSETARLRRHLGFLDGFALIGLGSKGACNKKKAQFAKIMVLEPPLMCEGTVA